MLAYVFWHWPGSTVTHQAYADLLIAFHEALARHPPAGFAGSAVFRCGRSPWIAAPEGGYQDWYLVRDSAALDALNAGAVGPDCRDKHDQVARRAAGGAAGLYRCWIGAEDLDATAVVATWFGKPAGMAYDELSDALRTAQQPGSCWMRQMVLGPTPEFCWMGSAPLSLPAIPDRLQVPLTALWLPD